MSNLAPVIPFLRYSDSRRAVDWLCDAFGFRQHAVYEGPDKSVMHAELVYGDSMIMLGSAEGGLPGMKLASQVGGPTMGIYMIVEDPDAHYAQAKAAGATITREPENPDYGGREYSCTDFEGNAWSFGTYQPEVK